MHNIAGMQKTSGGSKKAIPTPEVEAAAGLYWTDEEHSSLSIPARCLHASLIHTAPKYRVPKSSLTALVTSAMHVGPEQIRLNTVDYTIDIQSVVVQKARIFRARGLIYPWSATFSLFFDEGWIGLDVMQVTIPELIRTAGRLVGVLDYRPAKKGRYGQFRLVRYELLEAEESEPEPLPIIVGFPALPEPVPTPKPSKKKAA
jgi:hypothetical protein